MKRQPTVLVTGANGQLGQSLQTLVLQDPSLPFRFIFLDKDRLNIANEQSVKDAFKTFNPEVLVNCAAYTQVDKAEQEHEKAFEINATGVGLLAKACAETNALLLQISTDFVFDGKQNNPYNETAMTNPMNVYGQSKHMGEQLAMLYHSQSIIIRTSWLYSPYGQNFVKTMLRLGRERKSLQVVYDQIGSPTYAPDLAQAIVQLALQRESIDTGKLYHYANTGVASWYDLAVETFNLAGIDCEVTPILTHQYPTPAQRPAYSVLDTSKIRSELGLHIPYWRDSLAKCVSLVISGKG